MPFYQERVEFIPTATQDLVFCEYDKLRISFMVREGGRDEKGQSLGPVKVVSISGKGYGSMLPTPDEIKGILNLFGLDVQGAGGVFSLIRRTPGTGIFCAMSSLCF